MIVSSVAAFTGHGDVDPAQVALNTRLQDAMISAAADAQAEGISDNAVIRARMLQARDKVLGKDK